MGTIAQELTRIQNAKASLKTSIENKGVQVPANTLIDGYPALVDQIPQGGGGNPFDDCSFEQLCVHGRFVEYNDSLDLIKSSTRTNLPSWNFDYFARNAEGTVEQFQKLFDIFSKNIDCGSASNISCHYSFQYCKVINSPQGSVLNLNLEANRNASVNLSDCLRDFNYQGTTRVDLMVDFTNYNAGNIVDGNTAYLNGGTNCKYHLIKYPISKKTSVLTLTASGYRNIIEFTVKGDARYGINISGLTEMSIDNYIAFFNSFDTKTVSSSITITIPTSIYNQLTEDQKAIITNKNYLLASA